MTEEMEESEFRNIHLKKIYEIVSQPEILAAFKLTQNEQLVLELFWGKNLKFKEIADKLELSGERARQLYEQAAEKIISSIKVASGNYKLLIELQVQIKRLTDENNELRERFPLFIKENLSEPEAPLSPELLETKITDMDFSVRALHCFANAEIKTIKDLLRYSKKDLLRFQNVGMKTVNEIQYELRARGLRLK